MICALGLTRCKLPQVTIVGALKVVAKEGEAEAARLMFARHPGMAEWSQYAHKWHFYELDVHEAAVLDYFGGFHHVTTSDYFAATLPL